VQFVLSHPHDSDSIVLFFFLLDRSLFLALSRVPPLLLSFILQQFGIGIGERDRSLFVVALLSARQGQEPADFWCSRSRSSPGIIAMAFFSAGWSKLPREQRRVWAAVSGAILLGSVFKVSRRAPGGWACLSTLRQSLSVPLPNLKISASRAPAFFRRLVKPVRTSPPLRN
jgi:hypothetical protein